MVRGLDLFRERISAYADQYLLIGGTAASLTMEDAWLSYRATKDLDIVLHVEVLTPAFGAAFWQFVNAGGYQLQQVSDTGKPKFYRFQKPADERYPAMIELFARAPDGLTPPGAASSPRFRWMRLCPVFLPSCWTKPTTRSSWQAGERWEAFPGSERTG